MSVPDLLDPRGLPPAVWRLVSQLSHPGVAAMVQESRPVRTGSRQAAVLIMLGADGEDITFTERAAHMRTHPGQMSFPGGGVDPGEGVVEAALREAQEEVGLHPSRVTVLGQLPPSHVAASGYDVAGIVGLWDGADDLLAIDANEVAAIHRFAISDLADPSHRVTWQIPGGHHGPGFAMGDIFIWGFTAHLVDCMLALGGWAQAWDPSARLDVPERFFRP